MLDFKKIEKRLKSQGKAFNIQIETILNEYLESEKLNTAQIQFMDEMGLIKNKKK